MRQYGLPYMGSKAKIAEQIISKLPPAEHFYDLFAGGCAISHAALLSGKYKYIHANDITDAPKLFADAISGKYRDETRWISRDDFFKLKDTDPYVRLCWSFGNCGMQYLYSVKIEPYKRALHYAVMYNDFRELGELCPEMHECCVNALQGITDTKQRRVLIGRTIVKWLKANGSMELVKSNPLYNSCHRKSGKMIQAELQRLQSLESLERLQRPNVTQRDYRDIDISPNSIIYCDIPYKGTQVYDKANPFDYEAFYTWAEHQSNIYISEYDMPRDRFKCVFETKHRSTLCATANNAVTERLFVPVGNKTHIQKVTQLTLPL